MLFFLSLFLFSCLRTLKKIDENYRDAERVLAFIAIVVIAIGRVEIGSTGNRVDQNLSKRDVKLVQTWNIVTTLT